MFLGCETFRGASDAIGSWESDLRTDASGCLILEGRAAGRDHFFSLSGGGAAPPIALCGSSANVNEEFAWSEPGDNEVG